VTGFWVWYGLTGLCCGVNLLHNDRLLGSIEDGKHLGILALMVVLYSVLWPGPMFFTLYRRAWRVVTGKGSYLE
jgi:hypothetical protein